MGYGDPIQITFFAVNGAGSGTQAIFSYLFQKGVRFTYFCLLLHCYSTFVLLYFCHQHYVHCNVISVSTKWAWYSLWFWDCTIGLCILCCWVMLYLYMRRTIHICVLTGHLNADFHVACAQIKHVIGKELMSSQQHWVLMTTAASLATHSTCNDNDNDANTFWFYIYYWNYMKICPTGQGIDVFTTTTKASMTPMTSSTPQSMTPFSSYTKIHYAIGRCWLCNAYLLCFSYAFYGSVCGASVLVISTVVCVVCVIVCIKHKHKGTVSVYWHCMKQCFTMILNRLFGEHPNGREPCISDGQ